MRFWCGALIVAVSASALVAAGAPAQAQDACASLNNERDIDRCLDRLTRDAGLPSDEPVRRKPPAKAQVKAQPQIQPKPQPQPKPAVPVREAPAAKPPVRPAPLPVKTLPPAREPTAPRRAAVRTTPPKTAPVETTPRPARVEPSTPRVQTPSAPVAAQPLETQGPVAAPPVVRPAPPQPLTENRNARSGPPWGILLAVIAALVAAGLAAWAIWRGSGSRATTAAASPVATVPEVAPIAAHEAAPETVVATDPLAGDTPPPLTPPLATDAPEAASLDTAAPPAAEAVDSQVAEPQPLDEVLIVPPPQPAGVQTVETGGQPPVEDGAVEEPAADRLGGLKTWLGASGFETRDWRDLIISSARRVGARGYQALGEEERLVAALLDEAQTARSELFVAPQDKGDLQDAITHALGDQARLIWPQSGEPFDPRRHQSYPEPPAGAQIASVQRAGFTSNGQIFRAYVEVAPPAE